MTDVIIEQTKDSPRNSMVQRYEDMWGDPKECLKFVVAGGSPFKNTGYQLNGGFTGWVTKKAVLPAKWKELVNKYKDIQAPYFKYL